jgi:branched-chain amino acid transport system ATP-binding protein
MRSVDDTPILETVGLTRTFGAVVAANDINVSIRNGEVIGVIGANGAGKTTFVNMVTGYMKPSHGSIRFRGRDITALSPRQVTRLGICRSFQIPQLFPELSVVENLLIAIAVAEGAWPSAFRPLRSEVRIAEADRLLAAYAIPTYRETQVATLPQGVRKLLDIAMAMVASPAVLLLDEPTSGVSVEEKFGMMDTILGAVRAAGATVLFVEHDIEVVERYATRLLAFYDGRVIADGEPEAVLMDREVRAYVVGSEIHRRRRASP